MRLPSLFTLFPCWLILSLSGCTRIVDANAIQCRSDYDCRAFPNSICHPRNQVCVPGTSQTAPADARPETIGVAPDSASPDQAPPDSAPPDSAPPDSTPPDSAPTCTGGNGCFACLPTTDEEFLSACTEAICVPFDNRTRLANLAEDGSLKPLP